MVAKMSSLPYLQYAIQNKAAVSNSSVFIWRMKSIALGVCRKRRASAGPRKELAVAKAISSKLCCGLGFLAAWALCALGFACCADVFALPVEVVVASLPCWVVLVKVGRVGPPCWEVLVEVGSVVVRERSSITFKAWSYLVYRSSYFSFSSFSCIFKFLFSLPCCLDWSRILSRCRVSTRVFLRSCFNLSRWGWATPAGGLGGQWPALILDSVHTRSLERC